MNKMHKLLLPSSHTKRDSLQEDDTRSHLRAILTSIKQHQQSERLPRLHNQSVQITPSLAKPTHAAQPERRCSLPQIEVKSKHARHSTMNSPEGHIISNYLHAQLQVKLPPPPKPKRKKKSKAKQPKLQTDVGTIEQAQLETVRGHDLSRYASIDSKKNYSLKEEPMKHYLQQKEQRKKREWKQKSPMELQTYFVFLKRIVEPETQPTTLAKHPSKLQITVAMPEKDNLPHFIKHYQPKLKELKILDLIRKENFAIDYQDGELFFGEVEEGKRQGTGVLLREGYVFEGYWANGSKLRGYELTELGSYSGSFRQDKKEGKGQFRWANGQFYSGEWAAGKKHGVGLWTSPKGDSYMGEWKKGIVEGDGIHKTNTGQRYEGSFKNFLKHGWGKQSFPNGDRYEGEYAQGLPHGEGKYWWANGVTYEGSFFQGYRQGKGTLLSQNGFVFRGDFLKEYADGLGEIHYGNGVIYSGEIRQGKRNGKGTLRNIPERKLFDGEWKDNEFAADSES